jgi:hypothetical protein
MRSKCSTTINNNLRIKTIFSTKLLKISSFSERLNAIILIVMRVNLTNVLDEGLRIGGRGHRMNSKVKVSQTRHDYACIENKHGTQSAQSQSIPGRPLLAPIYRWLGFKDSIGFNKNYSVRIQYQLVF